MYCSVIAFAVAYVMAGMIVMKVKLDKNGSRSDNFLDKMFWISPPLLIKVKS